MTRSSRRRTTLATAVLTAALLPLGALPAIAATDVVAAPLPAPTGLAPADDPNAFPHTVRKDLFLHWDAVPGATGYRVQIGRDDTWSQDETEIKSYDVSGTTKVVPVAELPYATYVWRVAALKGSAVGHWTSETTNSQNQAEFTKGWRAAPTALAPVGGGQSLPDLAWTGVAEAARYEVQVSTAPLENNVATSTPDTTPSPSPQSPPVVVTCATTRTRLTPFTLVVGLPVQAGEEACSPLIPLIEPGAHLWWRVRGVDKSADGQAELSNWSREADFVVANPLVGGPLPAAHTDTAPLGDDPDRLCLEVTSQHSRCTDVPTIAWDPVPGATKYQVTLATDDQLSNVIQRVSTTWTSWTTTTSWPEGSASMSYYYDVQACDTDGCTPMSSTPRSFRKVSPRLEGLTSPARTGEAIFSWNSYATELEGDQQAPGGVSASQDAKTYRLQVATSDHPSYDVTALDVIVDGMVPTVGDFPGTTKPTFIPEQLGDGSYLWRVQPVDSAGNRLPWSLTKAFTRDNTAPRLLSVSPSIKVGVTQPLKLTFSEPVTGVSASSISVSPAIAYRVTSTTSTTATLTPGSRWLPGATYSVRPTTAIKDLSGIAADTALRSFSVNPIVDDGSVAIGYSSGWRVISATNAYGGRFHSASPTATYRPTASMYFRGTGVVLTTCFGPSNGYVDVLVDGVRKARVSTYRSYSGCGIQVANVTGLARGQHLVKVVAVGARVSASRGNNVALDALTVTP